MSGQQFRRIYRAKPRGGQRRAGNLAVLLLFLLAACAQTSFYTSPTLPQGAENRRVVIMPVDVELSELTAAGIPIPKADWTAAAHTHVNNALTTAMQARAVTIVNDASGERTESLNDDQLQLIKLHGAVGRSILLHQFQSPVSLPTKVEGFDWSLGTEAQLLKQAYGADFALFVFMRDSFSSAGRVAVIIVGALLGANIPGGQQLGFASLVDLETGQVVWFNRLIRGEGDLRTAEPATMAVEILLKDFPQ